MIIVFILALFASTTIASPRGYFILYGDVHKDVEFFTRTFPWIIDNIGGNLYVEYHLLGSGRYSIPQTCALAVLTSNTFLQAQYLRCEAKGYPSEYCLCEAGVEPDNFKWCVSSNGARAGVASAEYLELGINFSPVIDLLTGKDNAVFGVDDISFLKKICTIFGDDLPRGCIHYSNQTDSFLEKRALAQFDRACLKEFPIDDDKPEAETTTEWPWFTNGTTTSKPWVTPTTTTTTTEWPLFTTTTTSTPWVTPTTTPDWWSTTTTTPSDSSTTSPSSTPPPWSTTSPPWSTTSPPWSTTSRPWSTTSPPSSTTSPPWSTTSRPWFTTSTQSTRTTPQWPTTTPQPTRPTLWPTWWPTRTTIRPTLWPTRPTRSNPWAVNEEVTEAPIPAPE